jgi:RNA polymerase sigma-70 factor (ECF subfamily)
MRWLQVGKFADAPDEHAMRRVQRSGDPAAFAMLVARWETPIHRLCLRMVLDEHRAEDLTQETFARVFGNRASFDPGRRFSTWIWRIAINLCNEEHRRRKTRGETSTLDVEPQREDASGDPSAMASRVERADLVRQAVKRLSEEQRAVVVLREYEQLKFREIADVLEVPEGTVKWRMREALAQLAEQLKPLADEADVKRDTIGQVRLAL